MKDFKDAKHSVPEIENIGKKLKFDGGKKNMSLAKNFVSAFTTKSQMSDAEAAYIVNLVM